MLSIGFIVFSYRWIFILLCNFYIFFYCVHVHLLFWCEYYSGLTLFNIRRVAFHLNRYIIWDECWFFKFSKLAQRKRDNISLSLQTCVHLFRQHLLYCHFICTSYVCVSYQCHPENLKRRECLQGSLTLKCVITKSTATCSSLVQVFQLFQCK